MARKLLSFPSSPHRIPVDSQLVEHHSTLQQIDPVSLDPIEIFSYQAANQELATGGDSASHAAQYDHSINRYNLIANQQ